MKWMTVALIAIAPASAFAQTAPAGWPGLKLHELSTVYVLDDAGVETRGRLVQFSPQSLTLSVDGTERQFNLAHVTRIDRRGDSLRNGALTGALVGAGLGLATAGLSDCSGRDPGGSCPGMRAGVFLFSTAVYAAIGTAIDALVVGRTTVYVAPTRTPAAGSALGVGMHLRLGR